MRRNDEAQPNKRLPFKPKFRPPPMPLNYILADAYGPIVQRIPLTQENPHYNKTGVITRIDDDHRLVIDQMYSFDSSSSLGIHKVNDYILYECYDGANGALVVVKIERNYGRFRVRPDVGRADALGQHQLIDQFDHLLIGQVENKRGNEISMKESNLLFSLDNVRTSFVPEKDWVSPLSVTCDQVMLEVVNRGHCHLNRKWEAVPEPNNIWEDVRIRERQAASGAKPSPPLPPPRRSPVAAPYCFPAQLPDFAVPDLIKEAVSGAWTADPGRSHTKKCKEILNRIKTVLPFLTEPLNASNYTDKWHAMLFLEETQGNISIGVHNIPRLALIRSGQYYSIQLDPSPSKRPELVKGNGVIVKYHWNHDIPPFDGYIHHVKGDLVQIKLSPDFHVSYSGQSGNEREVTVEFKTGRAGYRRAHEAVDLALSILGPNILLAKGIESRQSQIDQYQISTIQWFNKDLDQAQKAVVTNILIGECRPFPYCIYGPPGTGKTITLIETILQLIKVIPDSRILVATPSNHAANLLAERLMNSNCGMGSFMIRLIASYLVNSDKLPDVIKPFCHSLDVDKSDRSTIADSYKRLKYLVARSRVTIGTCSYLGTLAKTGLPRGHFTHVVVDEAGQASEPETMIPLTYVNIETGQIILAGDPQQLGPVVQSLYSRQLGMEDSYLARILKEKAYRKDTDLKGYNEKLISKLNNNYRSLQEVLAMPSRLFYGDTLVSKVKRSLNVERTINMCSEAFDSSERLIGGVYVIANKGMERRAEGSTSCFNAEEARMVAETTSELYRKQISPEDIGIITPYAEQVNCIRNCFRAKALRQPKIGTVEQFQGLEKTVILISTVRSTNTKNQGFVQNPRRINVALTRAKVAEFIFCHVSNMIKDSHWRRIIRSAALENKYRPCIERKPGGSNDE